jgi:hypothetical protein
MSLSSQFEPEYAIEQSNLALCLISGQEELRYRDPPTVIDQGKSGRTVFTPFVAQTEEVGRLCATGYGFTEADIAVVFPAIRA